MLLFYIDAKDIDHIRIGTAKTVIAGLAFRKIPAVAQDIYVGKGSMKSHGAKVAALRIEIKAVAYAMAMMAAAGTQPIYDGQAEPGASHYFKPL